MTKDNTEKRLDNSSDLTRRSFFSTAGAGAALALAGIFSSCSKKMETSSPTPGGSLDVGAGDVGILNLIYALQQLERKFYSKVTVSNSVLSFTGEEKILLSQISVHENSHEAVLEFYLGSNALAELNPDFNTIDFNDRQKFLATARLLENNSVACMNSLAYQLKAQDLVTFAAKMVAVDARHAAYINNLISPGNFDDTTFVDPSTGMERPITVSETVTFVNSFLKDKISANHL